MQLSIGEGRTSFQFRLLRGKPLQQLLVGHADATVRVNMSWVFILSTPVKILLQGSRKPKLEFRCGEIFRMRYQYAEFKLVSRDPERKGLA